MKNLLKRTFLWFAIYAMDIQIQGTTTAMEHVTCPMTLGRMEISRHNARAERTRLRGEYESTFPVGTRRTWTLA